MSTARHSRNVLPLTLGLSVVFFSVSLSSAGQPSPAQGDDQKDTRNKWVRRQRFKSLDEAISRAEVELQTDYRFPVAVIVYTISAPDDQTVQARTEFRFVGKWEGGYIPGNVFTSEAVLQPVFITQATRPVELHIIAPGFQRYVRRVILHAGDLIIWDDIVLEPLTMRSAAALVGHVRLEGKGEDLEGLVIYVDGEAVAFTDASGSFAAAPVRPGKLRVSTHKPGYVGLHTEVKVPSGYQQTCELIGYRKRFAHVHWAYQPDGTRDFVGEIPTGSAVLTPGELSRVSFRKGFKQVQQYSDFLVTQAQDRLVLSHFDNHSGKIPGSINIKDVTFDELYEAPESGYERTIMSLHPGDLLVFHCFDGKHYAKMEVLDIVDKRPLPK